MDRNVIEKRLELEASPERVWKAITDPEEVKQWFGDGCSWKLEPGHNGYLSWQKYGRFAVRIEAVEAPRSLAWRWTSRADTPIEADNSTLVEWELRPRDDGGTTLLLRESGFQTPESWKENNEGWDEELGELCVLLGAQA